MGAHMTARDEVGMATRAAFPGLPDERSSILSAETLPPVVPPPWGIFWEQDPFPPPPHLLDLDHLSHERHQQHTIVHGLRERVGVGNLHGGRLVCDHIRRYLQARKTLSVPGHPLAQSALIVLDRKDLCPSWWRAAEAGPPGAQFRCKRASRSLRAAGSSLTAGSPSVYQETLKKGPSGAPAILMRLLPNPLPSLLVDARLA